MPDELSGGTPLVAPLPGVIVICEKNVGEQVQKGDAVLILEAMKMQILITAPVPGVVISIRCKEGERVEKGAVLALVGLTGLTETYVPEKRDVNRPVAAYKLKTGAVAERLLELRERERQVMEMGGPRPSLRGTRAASFPLENGLTCSSTRVLSAKQICS